MTSNVNKQEGKKETKKRENNTHKTTTHFMKTAVREPVFCHFVPTLRVSAARPRPRAASGRGSPRAAARRPPAPGAAGRGPPRCGPACRSGPPSESASELGARGSEVRAGKLEAGLGGGLAGRREADTRSGLFFGGGTRVGLGFVGEGNQQEDPCAIWGVQVLKTHKKRLLGLQRSIRFGHHRETKANLWFPLKGPRNWLWNPGLSRTPDVERGGAPF